MIAAFALPNGATMASSTFEGNEMDALARLDFVRDELAASNAPSIPEKPYLQKDDDGSPLADIPSETPLQWPDCISDTICNNIFAGHNYVPTDGGGDYVVGEGYEEYIGDQNGNGILERVVFYLYIPWMSDGIDNDADGCVDEGTGWGCDSIADGMVIYETGWGPRVGGDDGTLLFNLDWFSDSPGIEIFRVSVSSRWQAYKVRGHMLFPSIAGEFISYYGYEGVNGVNANPEMDNDYIDWYVGNIDARDFPQRPPRDQACSAGTQSHIDITFKRSDGWVVTSYSLTESYDDFDWNGDGDKIDDVASYYAVNPNVGNCRIGVNGAVQGIDVRNKGHVMIPAYSNEDSDNRDWNSDGDKFDTVSLYHDIDSSWNYRGRIYSSYTYNPLVISRQTFGFGWWALYGGYDTIKAIPLKFGMTYDRYVGMSQGYYHTRFSLVSDEDFDRHTYLPEHHIGYGNPINVHGGECIHIQAREYYLNYAGIRLIGGIADGNGDGDMSDILNYIFCPYSSGGGGSFVVDPGSKYAKGYYEAPIPFLWESYYNPLGNFEINSHVTLPIILYEGWIHDDCDGDGQMYGYCSSYFQYYV
jgi:hypothetical protein